MKVSITEVTHFTSKLFSFKTTRPLSFRFTAGQFTLLGMASSSVARPYSMVSGPYDEFLEFYSIKVPNGALTSQLKNAKIGDELELNDRPAGTLTLAHLELGGNLWLMATGTGIAPFISLLRDPSIYDFFNKIIVVHSVRDTEDLAYDEFLGAQDILYYPIVTRDKNYPRNQRITSSIFDNKLFTDLGMKTWNYKHDKVMLCGNMEFNSDMSSHLETHGWQQGTQRQAGSYVLEKAFVG